MNIIFEKMGVEHQKEVMTIFNYYIENSTAAFPSNILPEAFYAMLMKRSEGYPAYILRDTDVNRVIGFCQLSPYNPFSTFKTAACLSYFIAQDYTGNGLGAKCLSKLEQDALEMGITDLIAEISSENINSTSFHNKYGFQVVGELKNIGMKLNKKFSVIYMQKSI